MSTLDSGQRRPCCGRGQTRRRALQREENAWNAAHPGPEPEVFRLKALPRIRDVPVRELARRTGLSVAYCGRIRRGEEVPHQRWWGKLRA